MKTIPVLIFLLLFLPCLIAKAKPELDIFDGSLALVEIVEAKPFDASNHKEFVVTSKLRVHELTGRVVEIFDGEKNLINARFPMTPPPRLQGEANELTHGQLSFEGIADADKLNIGAKAILTLYYRKDFDPMNPNFNPYRFPDRSIFFALLAKPEFTFDKVFPEFFATQKEWAEWVKAMNELNDQKLRITHLSAGITNSNPLISVSSVHLFKRFYPDLAFHHFEKSIMASGTPVYARLAMDQEFCLSRGRVWESGGQKLLLPLLEREIPKTPEGQDLLDFRKQMLDNNSWFGRGGKPN